MQARVGRVLLECPASLRELFTRVVGVTQLFVKGEALPPFDVHAPLMSLPYLFKTTVTTVPAAVPYLTVEAERMARWRTRLPQGDVRIGVVWQGNPKNQWNHHRAFPPQTLAPLAAIQGVRLISLQKHDGLDALQRLPSHVPVEDFSDELDADAPFVDTAAVMTQLDLVVTMDTATAHLAGALGVPVWMALSKIADWRWLRGRDDTPWYPTMRLFHQRTLDDWTEVFMRMAQEVQRGLLSTRLGVKKDPLPFLKPVTTGQKQRGERRRFQ